MKEKVIVTGGAGFLGLHLLKYLLLKGEDEIVVFDKLEHHAIGDLHKKIKYFKGDINSMGDIKSIFGQFGPFSVVYHLAACMPDKSTANKVLWKTNVQGTVNLVKEAVRNKVRNFVFTSSNVAYGIPKALPVTEDVSLSSLEIYGKSKAQAEVELKKFAKDINIQIFRCPVISGIGRLGLQAILFEFISENKNVYILGNGFNKYQFVDADDVASALFKASKMKGFDIYNIGADEILSLRELYKEVIRFAKSKSRIVSLPSSLALFVLRILEKLNMSPAIILFCFK